MSKNWLGILLAISGSIMWGMQGPISQWLFASQNLSAEWLMSIKLMISGIILLSVASYQDKQTIFKIFKNPRMTLRLFLFAIFGLSAVQYFYFLTIKASNAPTTTVLQQLGTVMIILILVIVYQQKPKVNELIAVIIALLGAWLLVTSGHLTRLALDRQALILGLMLAFSGAMNTLLPGKLFKNYATIAVIGWAMLIGGLLFNLIWPVWHQVPELTVMNVSCILFIIIFGTALANLCFLGSLNYINPTTAGLLNTFEPLAATIGAVVFLKTEITFFEWVGGLMVISTVFILAWPQFKQKKQENG